MLQDLDRKMKEKSFEAIIAFGSSTYKSTELYYLVRSHIPRGGVYIKKTHEKPLLVVSNVDVKSAEKSMIDNIKTFTEFGLQQFIKKYNFIDAQTHFYNRLIKSFGIEGKIGIYGVESVGTTFNLIKRLIDMGHKVVAEEKPNLVDRLMEVKDSIEINKIKNLCSSVEKIISDTIEMIFSKLSKNQEITIGEAKTYTRVLMANLNLTAIDDFILSSDKDTADPHNLGDYNKKIKYNTPLIFDFYPRNSSLLYTDITRTYILGRASSELKKMYETVMTVQAMARDRFKEDVIVSDVVKMACDIFEKYGYPTINRILKGQSVKLEEGFIHSLGHGVGWSLSDLPVLSLTNRGRLKKGHVFTIEPGLYNPKIGGVRIEDVYTFTGKTVDQISNLDKRLEW